MTTIRVRCIDGSDLPDWTGIYKGGCYQMEDYNPEGDSYLYQEIHRFQKSRFVIIPESGSGESADDADQPVDSAEALLWRLVRATTPRAAVCAYLSSDGQLVVEGYGSGDDWDLLLTRVREPNP